jgi:murein DD-endopeptidase MepM/ murein hydrolase activator NlpD
VKRLLLVAAVALAVTGAARADTFVVVPSSGSSSTGAEPSQPTPTMEFSTAGPVQAGAEQSPGSTPALRTLWMGAGAMYGIPWPVLAAINKIESNFGRNMGPSSAGAIGWMQFMPSTWARWGTDADGDGTASPWNAADAIYSAARYLEGAGGRTDLHRAIFAYNHAEWYVNEVLGLAALYAQGGADVVFSLDHLQIGIDDARTKVADVNSRLVTATAAARGLAATENRWLNRADHATLLSDELELRKHAVQVGVRRYSADRRVQRLRKALAAARDALEAARNQSQAASFARAGALLLAAPQYSGRYVFPVGGGPGSVSVSHSHHDDPAADIAAPEGAPVYALADATVVRSWAQPNGNCGIGATIATADGQTWTYCHMSYLDPGVQAGATLAAGASIGLVGETGHATGPHLHLQLDPTNAYPQTEPWFQAFAGSAFRWQDAETPDRALAAVGVPQAPVFSVIVGDPVIAFTQEIAYFTR